MPHHTNIEHIFGTENNGGDWVIHPDWHSAKGVRFGELLDSGFDWGRMDWYKNPTPGKYNPPLSFNDRQRINDKIETYYYMYHLCARPGQFKKFIKGHLELIAPKIAQLINTMNDPDFHFGDQGKGKKSYRQIHSEYPASQIKTVSQDYADDAIDYDSIEENRQLNEDVLAKIDKLNDIDELAIRAVSRCFSKLLTYGERQNHTRYHKGFNDVEAGWYGL